MKLRFSFLTVWLLSLVAFAADPPPLPPKAASDAINAADLLKHIKVLASDEFEGRVRPAPRAKSFRSNTSANNSKPWD